MQRSSLANTIRLNKYIANCGISSRRKADEIIESGQVRINGKVTYELGVKINPYVDKVTIKGKPIISTQQRKYIVFNKPRGVLTSMKDPEGRPTVADFFKKFKVRLFPVGRLDWDTEGLLLMTNDGEFANEIGHPKKQIPKTYLVKLDNRISDEHLKKLLRGVSIIGGKVKAERVEKIRRGSGQKDWVKIIVHEGKNRMIRRMFEKLGFDVVKLRRVAIGSLKLGTLKPGEYAHLSVDQMTNIFKPLPEPRTRISTPSKTQLKSTSKSKHRKSAKDKPAHKAKKAKPRRVKSN